MRFLRVFGLSGDRSTQRHDSAECKRTEYERRAVRAAPVYVKCRKYILRKISLLLSLSQLLRLVVVLNVPAIMATRSIILPLLVLFSLSSALVSADAYTTTDANRTADGYGGYCNLTDIPKDLDCSSQFSGDYYGTGVRLGIYLTWITSWIANVFMPEEIAGALDANTMFLLSIMTSIFYSSSKGILSYIDGLILMHLSSGYIFGCLSFWGYRTTHYQTEGPMGIRHFGRFGTHCRLLLALAISGYGVWFWIEGVKDGLTIPVSPDYPNNPIPCQCYPLHTFFFAKLRVYGGIRYFYILMSTSTSAYFACMLLAAAAERIHHLKHVLNQTKPVFESVIYETGLTRKESVFHIFAHFATQSNLPESPQLTENQQARLSVQLPPLRQSHLDGLRRDHGRNDTHLEQSQRGHRR